jgi:hypothetical protein
MTRLADTGYNDTALAGETHTARLRKPLIQAGNEGFHCAGLDFERTARGRQQTVVVRGGCGGCVRESGHALQAILLILNRS